jgi:hypothetical protein
MRIAFIVIGNSRRSNYLNGDTIRYGGGGGSGTDGSSIIVAEQLALLGHEVVLASEKLEPHLEISYSQKEYLKCFYPEYFQRDLYYLYHQLPLLSNPDLQLFHQ